MAHTVVPRSKRLKDKYSGMDAATLDQRINKLRKRAIKALEVLRAAESVQREQDRE